MTTTTNPLARVRRAVTRWERIYSASPYECACIALECARRARSVEAQARLLAIVDYCSPDVE